MTNSAQHQTDVDLVIQCLSRTLGDVDWLEPLKMHASSQLPAKWAAIGFDTNALKQLRRLQTAARSSILTFLQGESVPIILPAQAVQEFWNNHRVFTNEILNLSNKVRSLAAQFGKVTGSSEIMSQLSAMADQLNTISGDIADAQDTNLLQESIDLWESLVSDATLGQVPRDRIVTLGQARWASSTAPGFADAGKQANQLGDFLVWADFLMGLLNKGITQNEEKNACIVFVTDDTKDDWITSGAPHPTLLGEVNYLFGMPLRIMTFAELRAEAEK